MYRASEIGLGRDVALKVLRPPTIDSQSDTERDAYLETLMQRFQREAQLLSRLRSPYTVTMYHYGKTQDGLLYMALEFIDGISLAELLRAGQPVDEERVTKILTQVLHSLKEAHAMGMLHRDLKPANIMIYEHLGERDQVKLLDFGIAKTVGDTQSRHDLTGDGTLIGTPRYMAPEQIQGDPEHVGPPSDIYALGLVGYELIVGERAIQGDSSIQIIGKQLNPQSFQLPPTTPCSPSLRGIINRMMAKSLDVRYASVSEVISDLELESIPVIQFEPLSPADTSNGNVDITLPDTGEIEILDDANFGEQHSKAPIAIIGGAIVGVLLVIGLVVALTAGDTNDSEAKTPEDPQEGAEIAQVEEPDPEPEIEVEEDPDPEPIETLIASNMQGVEILVNGESVGAAPLKIKPDKFPTVVTAKIGKSKITKTIDAPQSSLVLKFDPAVVEKENKPEVAAKPPPKKRTVKKTSKSNTTKKQTKYLGLE